MNVDVQEDRLIVVSDLHLGSPASQASRHFPGFVDQLRGTGWQLCINGDAFDFLQGTKKRLATQGLETIRALRRFAREGGRIHYTLGNHDLLLEHFLHDLPIQVAPFLNVQSGDRRIRIEHGHVHEPTYMRWPRLYHLTGVVTRYPLAAHKDTYRLWSSWSRSVHERRRRGPDDYPPHAAAKDLFSRGFDAAVFGHSHLAEQTTLDGGTFVNSGDWMDAPSWVVIDRGEVSLESDGSRLRSLLHSSR